MGRVLEDDLKKKRVDFVKRTKMNARNLGAITHPDFDAEGRADEKENAITSFNL